MKRIILPLFIALCAVGSNAQNQDSAKELWVNFFTNDGTSYQERMRTFDNVHYVCEYGYSWLTAFYIVDAVENPENSFGLPENTPDPQVNETFICSVNDNIRPITIPENEHTYCENIVIFNIETKEMEIRAGLETIYSKTRVWPEDGLLPEPPFTKVAIEFDFPVHENPYDFADRCFWDSWHQTICGSSEKQGNFIYFDLEPEYDSASIRLNDESFLVTDDYKKVILDTDRWSWQFKKMPDWNISVVNPKDESRALIPMDSYHGYYHRAEDFDWYCQDSENPTFFLVNSEAAKYGLRPGDETVASDTPLQLYNGDDALPIHFPQDSGNSQISGVYGVFFNAKDNTLSFYRNDLKVPAKIEVCPAEGLIESKYQKIAISSLTGLYPNPFFNADTMIFWEGLDNPEITGSYYRFQIADTDTPHEITITVPNGYFTDYMCRTLWFDTNEDTRTYRWQYQPYTGVEEIVTGDVASPAAEGIYDMLGRRMGTAESHDALPAGLYIIDGKKVLINR